MVLLAATPSTSTQLVIAIVTVALGGGIVSILRFRPDRSKVIAEASESAVEAMSGAMEELRRERDADRRRLELLEREAAEEREAQRAIRHDLKNRVADLEKATDIRIVLRGLIEIKDEQRAQREILERLLVHQGELLSELVTALKAADITIHTGGQS
jgi:septal ring factor EnvC (AmiA/AmiB activator)